MSMDWPEPIGLDETVRRLPPGKWYFISASVKANGDGTVYIDNKAVTEDSLGAAWAEAEAALPSGWYLGVQHSNRAEPEQYLAMAGDMIWLTEASQVDGYGSTPAAALRALSERLKERTG